MKFFLRNILSGASILVTGMLFSCVKGEKLESITWNDVMLEISLQDTFGNELFNPEDQAHFIGEEIVGLEFQGKLYSLESKLAKEDKMLRLFINETISKRHYLTFGPLDGALDMDETMLVKFTGNQEWEIRYICSDHNETTLSCQRKWFFNGDRASNPIRLVVSR